MARLAVLDDLVYVAGQILFHGLLLVEFQPHLIEVGYFQLGSMLHRAGCRREIAEQETDERRLANAIWTKNSNPVAAHDHGAKITDQHFFFITEAQVFRADDKTSGLRGILQLHPNFSDLPFEALLLGSHGLQPADTALITSAPSLDAFTNPSLLLGQSLLEQRLMFFFVREQCFFTCQKSVVITRPVEELAPVDLHYSIGKPAQERTVVGDEHHRDFNSGEELLKPPDGVNVEVVCRLIQQENIGLCDQSSGKHHPAFPTSGKHTEFDIRIQPHHFKNPFHLAEQFPAAFRSELILKLFQPGKVAGIFIRSSINAGSVILSDGIADVAKATRYHLKQ